MLNILKNVFFAGLLFVTLNTYADFVTFKKEAVICMGKENMEYIMRVEKSYEKDKEKALDDKLFLSVLGLRNCFPISAMHKDGKWLGKVHFEKIDFDNTSSGKTAKLIDGSGDAMYVSAKHISVVNSPQPQAKSTQFDENTCVAAILRFGSSKTEGGARAECQSSSTRKDNRYWSCMQVKANAGETLGSASASCQ